MSTTNIYPSLTTEAWLSSPIAVADKLMSDFFNSNYSQSNLYLGNVSSFAYVIQSTKGNPDACAELMSNVLKRYFLRYYKDVNIQVTTDKETNVTSKSSLTIYMTFKDTDDKEYSLGELIEMEGLKVNKIIKLNNEGTRI
jgi:hypothetical protein